jgi:NADH-quinone oxidoreductase subunit N
MPHDMAGWIRDVLPEISLVLGAILVLLVALFTPRARQGVTAIVAATTVVVSGVLVGARLGSPTDLTFAGTYAVDGATDGAALIILAATLVVIALSPTWFRTDPRHGEYYTILLFSALGAILLAGASDLIELILALLLSSLTGYVLTAYHRRSRVASEAAMKYFLLGALPSTSMLIGVALLFGLAATSSYGGLATGLTDGSAALVVGTALVILALTFKIGGAPLHAWVPDVAQGAPAPSAAFVTAVPKVGGLVALARFVAVLPADAVGWRPTIAIVAAATMTIGNLAALWQEDLRRLLGWSAVSQTGYGLLAVVALGRTDLAVTSLLLFLVSYVVANLAAFGAVVALRGRTARDDYLGVGHRRPLLAATIVVSFLSFIGIPPLVGFPAKLLLFGVAIEAGYAWLAVVAAVNTVVSVFYYVRFIAPMYRTPEDRRIALLDGWSTAAALASGVAVVVAGVAAERLVGWFGTVALVSGQ